MLQWLRGRDSPLVSANGKDVFGDWLSKLRDTRTQAKILVRLDRLAVGNFGDCRALREGLSELRINWGPGYRVYYAMVGKTVVLLLGGSDKRKQASSIDEALSRLEDYRQRSRAQ